MNEMTTGTGFKPIGVTYDFAGTFNGNEKVIYNIFVNRDGRAGLFINASNATIKNLTLTGEITGTDISAGIVTGTNVAWRNNCN